MYKARKSKYFVGRFEGVVRSITNKYVYASIVDLDSDPKGDNSQEVKIERLLFDALPKIKAGVFFNMYFKEKNGRKNTIVEQKRFSPISEAAIKKEAMNIFKLIRPASNNN